MASAVTVDHNFVTRHGVAWTRLAAEGSAYMAYALAGTPSGYFFAAQSEALARAADEAPVLSAASPVAIPDPAGSWYGRVMMEDFERRKSLHEQGECALCGCDLTRAEAEACEDCESGS